MPTAPSLTIEEYETIVENCQLGVAEPQKFVIKNPCVLNKLKSFHCIGRAGHLMRFLTWSKNRIYETYDKVFFPFICYVTKIRIHIRLIVRFLQDCFLLC
jgi:hypothetical protein